MRNMISKRPVAAYFIITFGWTWAIVLALILTGQADPSSPTPMFIIGGIVSGISPSLAAFVVSRASGGRHGTQSLMEGFRRKNALRWYVAADLTVPSITALATLISNFSVRRYEFSVTAPMIAMGLVWPLFSSVGEEFGWRGFILPRLLEKYSPLKAGVILGLVWEVWHLPMHYIAYNDYGPYMIPAFLVIGFINLTLQSAIMSIIFNRSRGGLKLMILYHYTITASSILTGALFKTDSAPRLVVNESILSVALFAAFAIILCLADRSKMTLKEETIC